MREVEIEEKYQLSTAKRADHHEMWERYYKLYWVDQPPPKWRLFYRRCPKCNKVLHRIRGFSCLIIFDCKYCDYEWARYSPPDMF